MQQNDPIEIYYSKIAYRWGLFVSFIFDAGGLLLILNITNIDTTHTLSFNPLSKYGAIGVFVLIGGLLLGRVYLKKLFYTKPALIIDEKGLTLNNDEPATIGWDKIDHIDIEVVTGVNNPAAKDKFIVPVLKNPEAYYNDTTKKLLGVFHNAGINASSDQPIHISTTFLKCSFDGLKDILETKLDEYNVKKKI